MLFLNDNYARILDIVRFFSPSVLAILAILFFSIFALKDLAKPGFYTNHDGETHTARIAQYYLALKDGQIPPRIAPSLYNGLGSPILTYIYPLPYFLASVVHTAGFSYTDSFEIIMALGFIASGIFAYFWQKELFQSEKAAFLGALFYIFVPYRFSLIYVRGSISENTAYAFVPLVLYLINRLSKKTDLFHIALTAISFCALMLSQNLVFLLTLPLIFLYTIYLAYPKKFKFLFAAFTSFIWAASISAFSYLPIILERENIKFNQIYTLIYADHFVSAKQLLYSPWGYGFSLSGTNDLMSFQIGLAHLLVVLIFVSILLVSPLPFFKNLRSPKNLLALAIVSLLIFAATVLLMIPTKLTNFIWQNILPQNLIDYPWRLLGVITVLVAIIAAYIAKTIKPAIFFLFLIFAVVVANRNHTRINLTAIFPDSFFENYIGTATQLGEFTPAWRQTSSAPEERTDSVETTEGIAKFSDLDANSRGVNFTAEVLSDSAILTINKFYFPKTEMAVDGQNHDFIVTSAQTTNLKNHKDPSGLMQITVPKGTHQVGVKYKETDLRKIANLISTFSVILALAVIAKNAKV